MLNTKLTKTILHTTDNYIKSLEKAGVLTVGDLLNHFPRDYDDRTEVLDNFSLINIKEKVTIIVKLCSLDNKKTANNKFITYIPSHICCRLAIKSTICNLIDNNSSIYSIMPAGISRNQYST